MNETYEQVETEHQLEGLIKPNIYSKRAIYLFAFLFSALVGGLLLMQNLKDIGKKKEAKIILLISIVLTAATVVITVLFPGRFTSLVCNIGGGAILSEYFYKKYFPDDTDYEKKKIWKPLLIALSICIMLIFVMVWAQSQVQQ
ncbi:MAG: hypothetical protein M3139_15125 [Bacteroidota bacterium]|nr:hypothetical protein [Bacteroidota bacterium]